MKPKLLYLTGILLTLMLAAGCSTKKNTAGSRFYHALTTRYNVYYNGNEAYKAGMQAQQQGNKDNYMELLPLHSIGNKATADIGKSDFDRAIEKAQKAIRQHSIKRRPTRKPGTAYTAEYKEWLARREFNPFIHRAWLLMGKAQFQKGDFPEAATTFAYIARLYSGQSNITSEALILLSRCYSAMDWQYDAEDALSKLNNDSLPLALATPYASATGYFLVNSQRYREAIPHLQKTAHNEKNKWQKARSYYLLGQVLQLQQQPEQAYQAYQEVIRLNPSYELELSARIRQTEVMSATDSRKVTGKLQRLLRDEKNKEYLDQIYYALGNVCLSQKDTVHAIIAYHKGVEKSTRNGVEKGMLQLTLGNLYWLQTRYADAQKAYTEAIGLIDNAHREYKEITTRSEILDELVPHLNTILLQDSLQHLASLTEVERLTVVKQIIAQVIVQEEAERKAAEAQEQEVARLKEQEEMSGETPSTTLTSQLPKQNNSTVTVPQTPLPAIGGKQEWYFYNPQVVEQGKAEFKRQWGQRKLEDSWRRKNKTVVAWNEFEEIDYNEPKEIIEKPVSKEESISNDSLPNQHASEEPTITDKHRPEYYLQQIPLTEESMQASNTLLSEALFHAGLIYKDRMQSFSHAEAILERLTHHFPEFKKLDEAYYQLFLNALAANYYGSSSKQIQSTHLQQAEKYKMELLDRFPQSRYAKILADPEFTENAVHGKHREDSLYAQTYTRYQAGDYTSVSAANLFSAEKYPLGQHRPKFMFLDAVSQLQTGQTSGFLSSLKEIVQQYPENEITDLAAHILKGVQEGRLLAEGSRPFGSIWQRRSAEISPSGSLLGDSTQTDSLPAASFKTERITPFLFIIAYEEGKVNENQLLFEVARYNFSTFLVKNFDLSFSHERGIGMLQVRPFASYDEAQTYFRQLYSNSQMAERLSGMRAMIISETNYELLLKRYSFDDYDTFYRTHFSTISEPELKGYTLDEPLFNLPKEDESGQKEEISPDSEEEPENGVIFED